MNTLKQLERLAAALSAREAERVPLIRQARAEGYKWDEIAAALRMSRAGVIKLNNSTTNHRNGSGA